MGAHEGTGLTVDVADGRVLDVAAIADALGYERFCSLAAPGADPIRSRAPRGCRTG